MNNAEQSIKERIRIKDVKLLSDNWYILKTTTFDYKRDNGEWQTQQRETYDRGHGAAILLYNLDNRTVILTKQFRYPAFVTNPEDGFLIEVAAGLLDKASPEDRIRAEAEEETGYQVSDIEKVFESYMSPGAVTEKLHLFVASYDPSNKVAEGGGIEEEGEEIEVLELDFNQALTMISTSEIKDAKTIMLLQHAALHIFTNKELSNV